MNREARKRYEELTRPDKFPGLITVCSGLLPGVSRLDDLDVAEFKVQRADALLMMDSTRYGWAHILGEPLASIKEFEMEPERQPAKGKCTPFPTERNFTHWPVNKHDRGWPIWTDEPIKHPRRDRLWCYPLQTVYAVGKGRVVAQHTFGERNWMRVMDIFTGLDPNKVDYLVLATCYHWREGNCQCNKEAASDIKLTVVPPPKESSFAQLLTQCSFEKHVRLIVQAGAYSLDGVTGLPMFKQAKAPIDALIKEFAGASALQGIIATATSALQFNCKHLTGTFGDCLLMTEHGKSLGTVLDPSQPYVLCTLMGGMTKLVFFRGLHRNDTYLHVFEGTIEGAQSLMRNLFDEWARVEGTEISKRMRAARAPHLD